MAQCVYCGKTQDLNTSLTITLEDDKKVSVSICDEHAEEATIKSAREAYQAKQDQINAVLEQAKALGLNISETGGGLTVATAPPPSEPAPQAEGTPTQPVAKQPVVPDLEGDDVVPTTKLDANKGMQSVGGRVQGTSVSSHASLNTSDLQSKLPEEVLQGKAKMAIVEGREGQPIAIPQKRVDGTGTTRITINKGGGDRDLQERFKRMAVSSQSSDDNTAGPDFRQGYQESQRDCPFCRGVGEVNDKECPKCKGAGFISIY
jgi:hypothetical protein